MLDVWPAVVGMTGWEPTTDDPTSTADMTWRCVCGETRDSLTAIQRHRNNCRQYRQHIENTSLSEYG